MHDTESSIFLFFVFFLFMTSIDTIFNFEWSNGYIYFTMMCFLFFLSIYCIYLLFLIIGIT